MKWLPINDDNRDLDKINVRSIVLFTGSVMEVNNLKLPESAKRAKILKIDFYYTGKPCNKGHYDVRYSSSGNCKKCIEEKRGKIILSSNYKRKKSAINEKLSQQAFNEGKTTYKSSRVCPNGHKERYVSSNNCVQCDILQRDKRKYKLKWNRIKKEYGLSEQEFNKMLEMQNYSCAICSESLNEKNTHIDHNHKCGTVRSLLCNKCNQGLGLFKESEEIFKKAIEYLKK